MNKADHRGVLKIAVGYLVLGSIGMAVVGLIKLCEVWPPLFHILLISFTGFLPAVLIGHVLIGE